MTRKLSSPVALALIAMLAGLFTFSSADAASKKPTAPARAAKPSAKDKRAQADKGREKTASRKDFGKNRNETRAERASKNERNSKNDRSKNERASRSDRRGGREDARTAKNDRKSDDRRAGKDDERKDKRGMSKRQRLEEARREAERRRREEAERRAELARQAAIARAAAIARQRAADQALKDEAQLNIAKDDTTGEDPEVRRVAVEALGTRAGTVVVMDPKSGRVYTVVNQDWGIRKGFKPCSTIKLVTGLAGLDTSVIDPVQTVNVGTGSTRIDLDTSLAVSNNGYFERVGGVVGFDRMMEYARKLGLGEPTGINHLYESPGRLPVFKQGYAVNHMSSHGDDIDVTPIQLANMTSAIANGGQLLVPHLPRTPEENVRFKREVKRNVNIPKEHLQRMLPGMIGAVSYGTAKLAQDPMQTVAGKTGSCRGQGSWLGLFTSYAPVQDPKLAVVVITRGSGERGKYAAGVAGRIYRGLSHRFAPRPGTTPMLANDIIAPRPKIDAQKAAALSDEERDEEATDGDAYVVSEADSNNAATRNSVQKTSRTIERTPATTAAPRNPSLNNPSSTPAVVPTPAGRPRRVNP